MSRPAEIGSLKVGSYVIIDGEPCRIVDLTKSKPGKHGSAKARVVAIGVFDGVKRSFVKPVSAQVDVPIIEKRGGQVIATLPSALQIMDLETYEVFEAPFPEDENLRKKLTQGVEIEYWQILGRRKIVRVKG
ncbi:MAG: translation initiation factor IF-5A [Candidatus Bathyarchaeota archaeon B26-1]|nr:MAG: translation initiation factor IF-5A [Candidatus Bathyarchaeota archaeon B26-1]